MLVGSDLTASLHHKVVGAPMKGVRREEEASGAHHSGKGRWCEEELAGVR